MSYDPNNPNYLINAELSKYSWKIKREFEELFPCKNPIHIIDVANKEYCFEQAFIAEQIKRDNTKIFEEKYTIECVRFESHEEFWKRWNRFKKIKSFI